MRFSLRFRCLLLCIATDVWSVGQAQDLPSQQRSGWWVSASSSADLSAGNIKRFLWRNRIHYTFQKTGWQVASTNFHTCSSLDGNLTENNILSQNSITLLAKRPLSFLWDMLSMTDQQRNIDFRWRLGPGARWRFFKEGNNQTTVSFALQHDQTFFSNQAPTRQSRSARTVRGGLSLQGKNSLFVKDAATNYTISTSQAIEKQNDWQFFLLYSLSFPLAGSFVFLESTAVYSYENLVAPYTKKQNLTWTTGLRITLEERKRESSGHFSED